MLGSTRSTFRVFCARPSVPTRRDPLEANTRSTNRAQSGGVNHRIRPRVAARLLHRAQHTLDRWQPVPIDAADDVLGHLHGTRRPARCGQRGHGAGASLLDERLAGHIGPTPATTHRA